ncbi:metallophosphoesterase family protein [Chloroflexota bacterium]
MRVGLLSDTHIPEVAEILPDKLMEVFQGVDLILHAGDIYIPSVLDNLEQIAPVLAARGDDDYGSTLTDQRVKERHILELEGKTLWLIHERPSHQSWLSPWWQSWLSPEQNKKPDIVVFGHEHHTFVQHLDGTLFISSGSPTFLGYRRGPGTVGVLDINVGEADVQILQL